MKTTSSGLWVLYDLITAFNAHDVPSLQLLCTSDHYSRDVTCGYYTQSREELGRIIHEILRVFPDAYITGQPLMDNDERAVFYWSLTGTQRGVVLGIPPTRKRVTFNGISVFYMARTRTCRSFHLWDMASMLRTMKLLPDLPEMPGAPGVPSNFDPDAILASLSTIAFPPYSCLV
jgi:steroid delta-isomerase-like uncharacterized protein